MGKSIKKARHEVDEDFEYELPNEVHINWKKENEARQLARNKKYEIKENEE